MTPRISVFVFGLILVLLTHGLFADDSQSRPNVVMIVGDDIAWSDYGFMGNKQVRTPHLDQLARESMTFTRGYVPASLCRPSLMSMISGLYPHQHLVTGNDPPKGTPREALLKHVDRTDILPKLLATEGYRCLQTGKWWEGNYQRGGFTHGMTHGDPKRGGRHGDEGLKIGRQGIKPITDFLDETKDAPFFIWYAPMLPHQPHNPPERLLEKYKSKTDSLHTAKYWAMIEWFDETCGQILDELKARKLEENTIVVYLADNGWVQQPDKATFDARSKRSRFDKGLRTPVLIRWPGKVTPSRDESTLVSSIDLAPTILSACGVRPAKEMTGVDLKLGRGGEVATQRGAIFGAIYEHDIPDIDQAAPGLQHRWCIHDKWKLIVPATGNDIELFDLSKDPEEQMNVADRNSDTVAKLRKELDAWWKP